MNFTISMGIPFSDDVGIWGEMELVVQDDGSVHIEEMARLNATDPDGNERQLTLAEEEFVRAWANGPGHAYVLRRWDAWCDIPCEPDYPVLR